MAIDLALNDVRSGNIGDVPNHLKNPSPDYKYPHNYGGYIKQQYLPNKLKDKVYYKPLNNGKEKGMIKKKDKLK